MEALFIYTAKRIEDVRFGKAETPYKMIDKQEIKRLDFWRAVFGEFLAQIVYVFLGCISSISCEMEEMQETEKTAALLRISLSFGLAMMAMFVMVGDVSGAHVSPAVTLAMVLLRRISLPRCVLYQLVQLVGAILGALMTSEISPHGYDDRSMVTVLGKGMTPAKGFFVEVILTFVLVIVFVTVTDKKRARLGHPGVIIGLTVVLCHLVGIRYTGAGMNPSRSLGAAIATSSMDHVWVYILGPFVGGVLAAFVYMIVLWPLKILSVEEALLKIDGESKV